MTVGLEREAQRVFPMVLRIAQYSGASCPLWVLPSGLVYGASEGSGDRAVLPPIYRAKPAKTQRALNGPSHSTMQRAAVLRQGAVATHRWPVALSPEFAR